jgi:hypothetical protein
MPDTQKPISDQQYAANRANAAKSTGPKTAEGKARSSQNAVKHGFTAAAFAVVRLEDLQEVANLKADIVSVYQPVNSQELFALERMALAQQAMFRASRLEAGLLTTCMNETMDSQNRPFVPMSQELAGDGDIQIARAQNRNYCLADGFQHQIRKSNVWSLFLRYQAQAERQYRRALEEFLRLKALRNDLPNEPILLQPEETPELCPPSELNPILALTRARQPSPTADDAWTTIAPSAPHPSAPDLSTPVPVGQAFSPAKASEAGQPAPDLPEAA